MTWKPAMADFLRETSRGVEADAILRSWRPLRFGTATCPTIS